jgi:hypothetical protein
VLHLAVIERRHKRENGSGEAAGWEAILNILAVNYGDRLELNMPTPVAQKRPMDRVGA